MIPTLAIYPIITGVFFLRHDFLRSCCPRYLRTITCISVSVSYALFIRSLYKRFATLNSLLRSHLHYFIFFFRRFSLEEYQFPIIQRMRKYLVAAKNALRIPFSKAKQLETILFLASNAFLYQQNDCKLPPFKRIKKVEKKLCHLFD